MVTKKDINFITFMITVRHQRLVSTFNLPAGRQGSDPYGSLGMVKADILTLFRLPLFPRRV